MSLHKSLKSKNKLKRQRNVLTRAERLARLERTGRAADRSVFGLPKVRVEASRKKVKTKKKEEEEKAAEEKAE